MKEHSKTSERELSDEETANLSDGEFKALVIKMLQELIGYLNGIKKTQVAIKVALCEVKKNLQGTNSDRKEPRTQSNILEQKEKNKHPTGTE